MKSTTVPVLILLSGVLLIAGCATQDDLRHVSRSLDAKIVALQATVSALQDSMEQELDGRLAEMAETQSAIRRSQADLNADMLSIGDELQRLRGSHEELQFQMQAAAIAPGPVAQDLQDRVDSFDARLKAIEAKLDIAEHAEPDRPAPPVPAEPERPRDSETLYSDAYGLFREQDYDGSREAFLEFLELYPDTEYSDNARFWIGESYYFQGQYEQAILEYQKVIEDYPQGSRVPQALLKQALSFDKLEERSSALLLLQRVVRDYPGTTAAETARSKLLELR